MKKGDTSTNAAPAAQESIKGRSGVAVTMLNAILRKAYRRHARGRLARAAAAACLGK